MFPSICNLPHIKNLNLSHNELTELRFQIGQKDTTVSNRNLSRLLSLELTANRLCFSCEDKVDLKRAISEFKNLEVLMINE